MIELTEAEITLAERLGFAHDVLRIVKREIGRPLEPFQTLLHPFSDVPGAMMDWSVWDEFEGKGLGALLEPCPGEPYQGPWHSEIVHRTRADLRPLGYLSFLVTTPNCQPCILVLKTLNPYEIIRVQETRGWDFDDKQYLWDDIIEVLRRWQEEYKFRGNIIGADHSYVKVELETVPEDLEGLADRLNFLCWELTNQIYGLDLYGDAEPDKISDLNRKLAAALAEKIRATKCLFLWWD